MNINFSQLPAHDIEGKLQPFDGRAPIGNTLFQMADTCDQHQLALKIYNSGEDGTEITDKEAVILRQMMPAFRYWLQLAVMEAMGDTPVESAK